MRIHGLTAIILFSSILFVSLLPCACVNQTEIDHLETYSHTVASDNSPRMTYWYQSVDGSIQTNDLERLQKEVPFTLIFPQYLLPELLEYAPVFYKYHSTKFETIEQPQLSFKEVQCVEVQINYQSYGDTIAFIRIVENNSSFPPPDGHNNGFEDWIFKDITIRKKESSFYYEHKNTTVQVFDYRWRWIDINFDTQIEGYDENVADQIIKSIFH